MHKTNLVITGRQVANQRFLYFLIPWSQKNEKCQKKAAFLRQTFVALSLSFTSFVLYRARRNNRKTQEFTRSFHLFLWI